MYKIANTQLWVHDQDEALAFYTEKLGMEVRADVTMAEMGNFRWLTVGPSGPGRRRHRADGDPRRAGDRRRDRRRRSASSWPRDSPARSSSPPTTAGRLRGACAHAASSSPRVPEERPYGIDCGLPRPVGQQLPADAGGGRIHQRVGRTQPVGVARHCDATPTGCRVAALSRFHTLMDAIEMRIDESSFSSNWSAALSHTASGTASNWSARRVTCSARSRAARSDSLKCGDSRHAPTPQIRSSLSPAFLSSLACMSTQTLQPLI